MDIEKRMLEMMEPIDKSIQLTDNDEDMLMLACAMMQRVREIFDNGAVTYLLQIVEEALIYANNEA